MFFKSDLNQAQIDTLETFIGSQGIYTETILDDEKEDLGTKIIFLQKAIKEDCLTFCESLDRLYYVHGEFKSSKQTNLELIWALKTINDLCFNNEVKVGEQGLKNALNHYFGSLGKINPNGFKEKIKNEIESQIEKQFKDSSKAEKINKEIAAAKLIFDENYNPPKTSWRKELDLPSAQLKEENKVKSKFNRPQVNALRYLLVNEELSFDDLQKKNRYEFERIFFVYFCLEGLSVPLAEGFKFNQDDLIFFMSLKDLVQRELMTFEEIKNLTSHERRLFEKLLKKEGEKTSIFSNSGMEFDIFLYMNNFKTHVTSLLKSKN